MPLYEYKCKDHGIFHSLATMEENALPVKCPKCQQLSPRVILIPPEVLSMAPANRKANEINERAANEPLRSHTHERDEASIYCPNHQDREHHHQHLKGSLNQKAVYLADGSKVFPSQRPWMISH